LSIFKCHISSGNEVPDEVLTVVAPRHPHAPIIIAMGDVVRDLERLNIIGPLCGWKLSERSKQGMYFRKRNAEGLLPLQDTSHNPGKARICDGEIKQIFVGFLVKARFD
jgi:hypothetical protein